MESCYSAEGKMDQGWICEVWEVLNNRTFLEQLCLLWISIVELNYIQDVHFMAAWYPAKNQEINLF